MITADWLLSPAARAWLMEHKAIADAATKGPWFFARINGNELESLVYEDGEDGDSELIPALTTDANWSLCEAAANNYAALLTALLEAGEKREWRLVWGTGYTHNAIDRADAEATCRIWREFPPMPAYADVTIESRRPAGEWEREKEKLP